MSLLHFACFEGNLHIVKYIIKVKELDGCSGSSSGLGLNEASTESGETPLHMAVSSGQYAVVKYLLINNADKSLKCKANLTPLDKAKLLGESGELEK